MSEWKTVRLGDCITEYSVKNKSNEDIPVYSVTNTQGFCTEYFSKDVSSKDKSNYKIVPRGCFAYNPSRINVGSVDWQRYEDRVIVSPLYNVFKVSPELENQYLYYFLKSDIGHTLITSKAEGSVRDNLKITMLAEFSIPLPPLEEQKHIAAMLDKCTALVTKYKLMLEKYDTLIKSRFIEMFGDPVINEKDWDLKTLPELGEFGRGVSKHRPRNAPELLGGKYPLIQTGDVANANLYITDYESTYSEEGFKQSKMWKAGTLCITIAATIAKTAILTFDSCFPDSVVGFTPNEKTNSLFINYWFSFFQKILEEQAPAVAQKNINLQVLSELKIITPPISLQNDFAAFVQQIDKSKFAVQKALEKTETLYKSLMQRYFA